MDHSSEELMPCDLPKGLGRTPMVEVDLELEGKRNAIHLKLESSNPMGSVKDRTAWSLINYLEHTGQLKANDTVVESTSGNLGAALAAICQSKRYKFVAVVDPKTSEVNMAKMRCFGATIELVKDADSDGNFLEARLSRVRTLCSGSERVVWANQYGSPANPWVHYRTTAPETYSQMRGRVDAIFIAVSTGGTLAGISRYYRRVSPSTMIVAVDAAGSVALGGTAGPRKLIGIGSTRVSSFLSATSYDEAQIVTDEEAFAFCRLLYRSTGLRLGGSSGAVLAACARYIGAHGDSKRLVCLCPDDGHNYTDTIFSEQ